MDSDVKGFLIGIGMMILLIAFGIVQGRGCDVEKRDAIIKCIQTGNKPDECTRNMP